MKVLAALAGLVKHHFGLGVSLAQGLMHGGGVSKRAEGPDAFVAHGRAVVHIVGQIRLQGGAAFIADDFKLHLANAALAKIKLLGGGKGKVDDAAAHKGATVGHANHDAFAVFLIGYPHDSAHGQGAVGGGECIHVIAEAAGSGAAVRITTVPGCLAGKNFTFLGALEPDVAAVGALFGNLLGFR